MGAFHQRYDLLLTPTMPIPALPAGQDLNDPVDRTSLDRLVAVQLSVQHDPSAGGEYPLRVTAAGLPIGLQIVGPLYGDARVLRAARAFETTQPERRPPQL